MTQEPSVIKTSKLVCFKHCLMELRMVVEKYDWMGKCNERVMNLWN